MFAENAGWLWTKWKSGIAKRQASRILEKHTASFEEMAAELSGYADGFTSDFFREKL